MNEEILSAITEEMPEFDIESLDEPNISQETSTEEDNNNVSAQNELTSSEEFAKSPKAEEPTYGIEELRAELEALRAELRERRGAFERMSKEIGEFSELFPTQSLSTLPDSVWESVKAGVPLAASFALYEKRSAALKAEAELVNERNRSSSTGPVGRSSVETFFSPNDVRKMSREEIKTNYSTILESMKKWN